MKVLLKLSGEVLGKDKVGFDFDKMLEIANIIKEVKSKNNLEIAIVVGGGNFYRGRSNDKMDACTSDYIGMLATTMNALALKDAFLQVGLDAIVQTSVNISPIIKPFNKDEAVNYLKNQKIVIFGAGTGLPFFSTDTAASLRCLEIGADILLKATNVDYLYDKDPKKYNDYKIIKETTYEKVIEDKLKVMDLTAITLCMENHIPIRIFNLSNLDNLKKVLLNEEIGSIIH